MSHEELVVQHEQHVIFIRTVLRPHEEHEEVVAQRGQKIDAERQHQHRVLKFSLLEDIISFLLWTCDYTLLESSAKPVIALEGSYILEPPEALEQLTFLRSPLEG